MYRKKFLVCWIKCLFRVFITLFICRFKKKSQKLQEKFIFLIIRVRGDAPVLIKYMFSWLEWSCGENPSASLKSSLIFKLMQQLHKKSRALWKKDFLWSRSRPPYYQQWKIGERNNNKKKKMLTPTENAIWTQGCLTEKMLLNCPFALFSRWDSSFPQDVIWFCRDKLIIIIIIIIPLLLASFLTRLAGDALRRWRLQRFAGVFAGVLHQQPPFIYLIIWPSTMGLLPCDPALRLLCHVQKPPPTLVSEEGGFFSVLSFLDIEPLPNSPSNFLA